MPWEHCGASITDDQPVCPSCGASKPSWTMTFNKTRMFKLGRTWEGDPAAQAEALKTDSPFCEECTKKANPEQDEPHESPEEPETDTETQTEGLKTASDSGSPFCEECTKRANEEAA